MASIQVPDTRLDYLSSIFKPEKTTYAVVEFVDVPALTRGRGQDVALAPLRTVDVLIHVARAFEVPRRGPAEGQLDQRRHAGSRRHAEGHRDVGGREGARCLGSEGSRRREVGC